MRLLLDTHAFLWFITNDPQLSAAARRLIADPTNDVLVSLASYWEIAIKVRLGKYPLTVPYLTFITQGIDGNDAQEIEPLEADHAPVAGVKKKQERRLPADLRMVGCIFQAAR